MRPILLLLLSSLGFSQINLIPPAANGAGNTVVFGAATDPDGTPRKGANLYLHDGQTRRLTNYSLPFTGVTGVTWGAGFVGFTAQPAPAGVEEVHLYDVTRNADRTLVSENLNCFEIYCVDCQYTCMRSLHLTADGATVLYSVETNQPFRLVNADGSQRKALPVYSGAIAPSPQRVISRGGQLVFTSSAPSGPTFAAAATDVYVIHLDGTGLRQVTRFGDAKFIARNATSSADGSIIVFESNYQEPGVRGQAQMQIWMVRSDGTGLRRLTDDTEAASSPSISADGSTVVFYQRAQLKRAKTSGSVPVLTLTEMRYGLPYDPVVSDDGSSVVFTVRSNAGGAAIYRIPADALSGYRSFQPIYTPRTANFSTVVNWEGFGPPSPGSLIRISGTNLGVDEAQLGSFPLPDSLNGVSLLVNGRNAPIFGVTPWEIVAVLPQSVAAGEAEFQIPGVSSGTVEVQSTSPEILLLLTGETRYVQAAAFHAGTGVAANDRHPVEAGAVIEIYGLGLGVTDPSPEPRQPSPASPPARALRTPRVQIGGRDASVIFAGLAPGLAGVYQVNVVVPELPAGIHELTWDRPTATVVSIAVK